MNTGRAIQIESSDSSQTEQLGERLGQKLKGGEVIELASDLGGGKTTFVRGLAKGMGSQDMVASPTFTIRREYHAKALTLYHFDFYRLNEPAGIAYDLAEVVKKPRSVVVVEWGEIVKNVLPAKRLIIHIKTTGEATRLFKFNVPKSLAYLLQGLK